MRQLDGKRRTGWTAHLTTRKLGGRKVARRRWIRPEKTTGIRRKAIRTQDRGEALSDLRRQWKIRRTRTLLNFFRSECGRYCHLDSLNSQRIAIFTRAVPLLREQIPLRACFRGATFNVEALTVLYIITYNTNNRQAPASTEEPIKRTPVRSPDVSCGLWRHDDVIIHIQGSVTSDLHTRTGQT